MLPQCDAAALRPKPSHVMLLSQCIPSTEHCSPRLRCALSQQAGGGQTDDRETEMERKRKTAIQTQNEATDESVTGRETDEKRVEAETRGDDRAFNPEWTVIYVHSSLRSTTPLCVIRSETVELINRGAH